MTKNLSKTIRSGELNEMTINFNQSMSYLELKFKATGKVRTTISSELTEEDFNKEVQKYSRPTGYLRTIIQNLII